MSIISVKTEENSFEFDNFTVLTFKVEYPQINSTGYFPEHFNSFYHHEVKKLHRAAEKKLFHRAVADYEYALKNNTPFYTYELSEKFNVTLEDDKFISLYRDVYTFTGGAHGNTLRLSESWCRRSGWLMPLGTMFPRNVNYRRILTDNAIEIAKEQITSGYSIYFDDFEKLIKKNFSAENYYLTDKGVVLYYQQYEIAPYSEGIPEFLYSMDICCAENNNCGDKYEKVK